VHLVILVEMLQETLADRVKVDDEEAVHRVPSWPITTGRKCSKHVGPAKSDQGGVPVPGHHGAEDTLGRMIATCHQDPVPELPMKLPSLFVYTALTELAVIGPQVAVDAAVALAVSVTVQKVVVPSVKVTVPVGLLGAGS
jgi:hypothetical protein